MQKELREHYKPNREKKTDPLANTESEEVCVVMYLTKKWRNLRCLFIMLREVQAVIGAREADIFFICGKSLIH